MKTRWPKLPKTVYGTGGEITVKEVPSVKDEKGVESWGTWEPSTRTIEIDEKATPRFKWCTLFHEMMHATLSDSGLVNLLTDESQEALCEAVGTARLVELAGRLYNGRAEMKKGARDTKPAFRVFVPYHMFRVIVR